MAVLVLDELPPQFGQQHERVVTLGGCVLGSQCWMPGEVVEHLPWLVTKPVEVRVAGVALPCSGRCSELRCVQQHP